MRPQKQSEEVEGIDETDEIVYNDIKEEKRRKISLCNSQVSGQVEQTKEKELFSQIQEIGYEEPKLLQQERISNFKSQAIGKQFLSSDCLSSSLLELSTVESSSRSPSPRKCRVFSSDQNRRLSAHNFLKISVPLKTSQNPQTLKDSPKKYKDQYINLEKLGQGSQGEVRRCKHIHTEKEFAAKIISFKDGEHLLNLSREFFLLKSMRHPNVISAHDFFIENKKCYIILEYVDGFSLQNFLVKSHRMNEEQTKFIATELLKTIQYLHFKGICHRDITCNNILIDDVKSTLKLIDLSNSKSFYQSQLMMTKTGTLSYMAPEIFNDNEYDCQVDVWSVGIVLFYLLSGRLPFLNSCETELIEDIRFSELDLSQSNPYLSHCTSESLSFLKGLLQKDPKNRFSVEESLNHPWLRSGNLMYQFKKNIKKIRSSCNILGLSEKKLLPNKMECSLTFKKETFRKRNNSDFQINNNRFLIKCLSLAEQTPVDEGLFIQKPPDSDAHILGKKEDNYKQETQKLQVCQDNSQSKQISFNSEQFDENSQKNIIDNSNTKSTDAITNITGDNLLAFDKNECSQENESSYELKQDRKQSTSSRESQNTKIWEFTNNDTNFNDKFTITPEVLELENQVRKKSRSSVYFNSFL